MNKRISTALCPQCGAQGTAGRFCEYCGTKIPEPKIDMNNTGEEKDFSWYTICPLGWEPYTKNVIGNLAESQFMVVIKRETYQHVSSEMVYDHGTLEDNLVDELLGKYVPKHQEIRTENEETLTYCIINRQGKFVIGTSKHEIYLFTNNNDYLVGTELLSLNSDVSIEVGGRLSKVLEKYIIYYGYQDYRIFNRESRTKVNLNNRIPYGYGFRRIKANDEIVFKRTYYFTKQERTCTVTIEGDTGSVSFTNDNEVPYDANKLKEAFVKYKRVNEEAGGICIPFEDIIIYRKYSWDSYKFYDLEYECYICMDKSVDGTFEFSERLKSGVFLFRKGKKETCTVEIKEREGIVTFNESNTPSTNSGNVSSVYNNNEGQNSSDGCIIGFLLLAAFVFFGLLGCVVVMAAMNPKC